MFWTISAPAQVPVKQDSAKAKADSAAVADSIRLVRDLERAQQSGGRDTNAPAQATPGPTGYGPTNPRLLPDISAVGDLVGDLSPKGTTQEDGTRFSIREMELAVQAAVDPYFRGDVFLGISDVEKISIEQAFLTATSLPYGLEVKLGRYLMPFGKQNLTHRHDLHTVEYPYVIQQFFAGDGLKGTGLWASKIFAPFGFYQELQVTAVDLFGERSDALTTPVPLNKSLSGMGYSARFRNYLDLSQSTNFELSGSAITGRRAEPLETPVDGFNAVGARQSVVGADLTFRWRPLQQGLYKSFILQAEFMRQFNEQNPELPVGGVYAGPLRNISGAYVFGRYQLTQRIFLGSRADWVQNQNPADGALKAIAGDLEFFPSEFSKLVVQYERLRPATGVEDVNRVLLQASFALGPHKPHPF
jgi:hypothetical protein